MLQSEQKETGLHPSRNGSGSRHYKVFVVDSRLKYFKPHAAEVRRTFADEIAAGLNRRSKYISPKFFYDRTGSDLFEEICGIPEYYLTRTEIGILRDMGDELASLLMAGQGGGAAAAAAGGGGGACAAAGGGGDSARTGTGMTLAPGATGAGPNGTGGKTGHVRLVELGSGSSTKTRLILEPLLRMQGGTEYFPIDISDILAESSERLLADYKNLEITGIIDTYEGGLEFLRTYDARRNLIIFLGSSYGNLSPVDGSEFLCRIRSAMKPGDLFLLGLDMVKDAGVLRSAYDDPAGATARFNLNVLSRINAELGADFDLANFAHRATYNEAAQRVEMHIESLHDQSVTISKAGLVLKLQSGELIHTENSYKYCRDQVCVMLEAAGLVHLRTWTDRRGYFTLTLAEAPLPQPPSTPRPART